MSLTEQEKRTLSSSSVEESEGKRVRMEDEPMPTWAKDMMKEMMAEIFTVKNNTNSIMLTVNDVKNNVRKVEANVDALESRLERLEMNLEKANEKIATLESDKKVLEGRVDKAEDNSCRDTLTIHGIPRKIGKESWDDTEEILAQFLSEHSAGSKNDWLGKITRAHRGKPQSNVIHCLFRDWKYTQECKELFRKAKGKINFVHVLEKFSIPTQDRRNLAQERRELERKKVPGSKIWIKYPATLMCERPGEKGYKAIATF
jgi:chromosome segregation ATPase